MLFEILVASVLVVVFSLYIYDKWKLSYWKRKNVPSLKPISIFGNIWPVFSMKISMGQWLDTVYNKMENPCIGVYMLQTPFLVVKDLEIIKAILVKDFNQFSDRSFANSNTNDGLGTKNLFTIKNPQWKHMRTKLSPFFTSGKLKQMFPLMYDVGKNLTMYIQKLVSTNEEISVESKEMCAKYSTDVIATCAFGIEANSFLNHRAEFREVGRQLFNFTIWRSFEFNSFFFAPTLVKLFAIKLFGNEGTAFLRKAFTHTLNEREAQNVERNDLIDILIQLKNKEKSNESNEAELMFEGDTLVAQAAIFYLAGFETTASAMSFTLYHLAINPNIQNKVREEIKTILSSNGRQLSYDSINEMEYLHMCINETLRLHPATPVLFRDCTHDYNIPNTNIKLEKGTSVLIPLETIQKDEKYFPTPNAFIPERFSKENKKNILPFSYLPFGEGPHNCIGKRFGLLQVATGLVHILKECKVEPTEETKIPLIYNPKAFVTTPINGIPLKLVKDPLII